MTHRLSKTQSGERWSQLRALIYEWDPMGVMGDPEWARDEYDCLLGPVMRLLETGARQEEITSFLRQEIEDHFGLNQEYYDLDRKLGTDLFFNDGLYVRAYFPAKDHKRLFLEEVEITSPRFKIKITHGLNVGTASLLRSSGNSILIEALG